MKIEEEKNKGITLMVLVITIVILLILASVATYSGIEAINIAKLNKFTAEMKIMQTNVNNFYDKWKNNETVSSYTGDQILNIGKDINVSGKVNKVFSLDTSGIIDTTGYRYFDKQTIKDLKIDGVTEEFFINIEKRSIISCNGLKYDNNTYYTLEQLPNSLYNVEYNENTNIPTFNVQCDLVGENKYKVVIDPIYNGNIEKWEVKYQLDGSTYWNTSEELTFYIEEAGNYNIKIQNGKIKSETQTKYLGYATEGIILHYDGIINTRNGSNKGKEVTVWEDLSGNRNDSNVTITDNTTWQKDSLKFENTNEMVKLPQNVVETINSKKFTIQFLISDYKETNTTHPTILWSTNDNLSFYADTEELNLFRFKDSYSNNKTNILKTDVENKIVTIEFDLDNNSIKLYSNTEQKNKENITSTIDANNINIGRNDQNNTFSLKLLRIYNSILSENDRKINYELDKSRFNIQ